MHLQDERAENATRNRLILSSVVAIVLLGASAQSASAGFVVGTYAFSATNSNAATGEYNGSSIGEGGPVGSLFSTIGTGTANGTIDATGVLTAASDTASSSEA